MSTQSAPHPPLDVRRLADLPGYAVEVVGQAPSTNALVAQRAAGGAPEGLVVVAEHQTAGRGRLDRSWETPARAALTFSVLLRPDVPPAAWPWLPLLAGLAVDTALRGAGVPADLKWPNDVLVAGRKVAGILVERIEAEGGPAAVVGIGVNVSMTAEELPVPTATSLTVEGFAVDRTDLLRGILAALREHGEAWRDVDGQEWLRETYAARCVTAHGQRVSVLLPSGDTLVGEGLGIADTGALRVHVEGEVVEVNAGDVVHVRPADQ